MTHDQVKIKMQSDRAHALAAVLENIRDNYPEYSNGRVAIDEFLKQVA